MTTRKTWFLVLGIASAAILVAACGAAFIAPDVSPDLVKIGQSRWADTTQESMQQGHDLFVASCGKGGFCHKLPTPKSRTEAQWPQILVKMGKNAKLDDAQRESVQRYILAVRDLPAAPAPAPAN